jgi:hypothetical protein
MIAINYALICVVALSFSLSSATSIEHALRYKRAENLRRLSGQPTFRVAPAQSSFSAPAAPAQSSYSAPAAPPQSSYSAPAQSSYSAPAAPAQSSYSAPAQSSYSAPAQSSYSAPAQSSYSAPAQSSYSAPAQSSYSAPAQSSYSAPAYGAASYGDADLAYSSPMQSYYQSQPAIQQLIQNMVNQYHGYGYQSAPQEPANTCSVGYVQTILENNQVSETYCRCPTGTYGFTCTENFVNPCVDGSVEYANADSRVPPNYFIKCSWGIPYLNKCPAGTTRWSQELYTCISDGYGAPAYGQAAPAYGQAAPAYGQVAPAQSSYAAQPSYGNSY